MNHLNTKAIVLSRTNYGEADRIITALTPSQGKVRLMAKGTRKEKSKLAGGIELFCINDITFIQGKHEIGTLISSRMDKSFSNIIKELDRVQLGYDLIKLINKVTEDHTDPIYFDLLKELLVSLDLGINVSLIDCWFQAQLLVLAGHSPNLSIDQEGAKLDEDCKYYFDISSMILAKNGSGKLGADEIKVLRLLFSEHAPSQLSNIQKIDEVAKGIQPLIVAMVKAHLS